MRKLNQAIAEALEPRAHPYVHYDRLPGFGVRVAPGGTRSWVFEYRPGGGRRASTKRITIGRVDVLPYSKARKAAESLPQNPARRGPRRRPRQAARRSHR